MSTTSANTRRTLPIPTGDPAPWFLARTRSNPRYAFNSVGGRYVVLSFFESAATSQISRYLQIVRARQGVFDDTNACFFGVSADPADESTGRLVDAIPGIRFFFDTDRSISTMYGAVAADGTFRCLTYVLDPLLRVVAVMVMDDEAGHHARRLFAVLESLPPIGSAFPAQTQAPVLVLPRVFEPKLCRALIRYYENHGGLDSGFMREEQGLTVTATDYGHKRRRDCEIQDESLRTACMVRVHDRIAPEVAKAFQFQVTRMERYIVACYDAREQGHFRPHRDNTTKGTAHRRFAASIFLNTDEYEGGALRFPEFGPALYSAPPGGAVVFSCSLLHEAMPVTSGSRYVFVPFLYDEAARQLREENFKFLEPERRPAESRTADPKV